MFELLKKLAFILLPIPSKGETESDAIFQWRQAVGLSIILIGGIEVLFIMIATGYLSFAGINGFAMASDVQVLIQQNRDEHLTQIENTIKGDRTLQCEAIMEGNRAAMAYSYDHLRADLDAMVRAGFAVDSATIPPCDQLIAAASGVQAPTPVPSVKAAK